MNFESRKANENLEFPEILRSDHNDCRNLALIDLYDLGRKRDPKCIENTGNAISHKGHSQNIFQYKSMISNSQTILYEQNIRQFSGLLGLETA